MIHGAQYHVDTSRYREMSEELRQSPNGLKGRTFRLFLNLISGMFGAVWIVLGLIGAYASMDLGEVTRAILIGVGLTGMGALVIFIAVRAYRGSDGFRLWKEDLSESDWAYVRGSMVLGIITILGSPFYLLI